MSTNARFTIAEETSILHQQERRGQQAVFKRAVDSVGALFLLCFLSPLLVFIACLIVITDGLPIIYRRRVVGMEGEFDAYKFRSMCRNADAILKANPRLRKEFTRNFKLQSDPRVTRLGGWLRKYSLDELPQLLNVLRGQMSLVGPRMITAPELAKYGEYQDLLKTVKPGLTGYWQTRGRQETSYEERVRMDVHYITHQTLGLDLLILFQTPWTVIKGKGAY
jgi:lipopolysaccharide/colanic/teichoic acid biosynthesis glycosyltransferase